MNKGRVAERKCAGFQRLLLHHQTQRALSDGGRLAVKPPPLAQPPVGHAWFPTLPHSIPLPFPGRRLQVVSRGHRLPMPYARLVRARPGCIADKSRVPWPALGLERQESLSRYNLTFRQAR